MEYALATLDALAMELRRRRPHLQIHDDYYRGNHRLAFASDHFRKYFGDRYRDFSDNWCQVVADAPVERLCVSGVRLAGKDTGYDKDLWQAWQVNEAGEESDLAFLEATIGGRAFGLVWGDDEDEPVITFEHPTQAIVSYDPATRKRAAGLKLWQDDEYEYATLYLPDEVWKFQAPLIQDKTLQEYFAERPYQQVNWVPRQPATDDSWPIVNPFGVVPLVEMRNRPRLVAEPMSDIRGTIAMQDAMNLLWAYLFNSADFASLGQRIVMGAERPKVPILDENGQPVGERDVDLSKFAVDRILWVEDPNAKVGQWDAAQLAPYTGVLDVAVRHLASQSRTPTHYFDPMSNLSADALKAAETGLVKRIEEKTVSYGRGVRDIFRLVALAQGNEAKAKAVQGGCVLWKDIENRSEAQLADSLLKLRQIGFPFEFLAERYGLSPSEIQRVMDMRKQEAESDPLGLLAQADPNMPPGVGGDVSGRSDSGETPSGAAGEGY